MRGPWSELFKSLREIPRPFAVCGEASNGYRFPHEGLSRLADRFVVGHPGQLRLIFRSKRKNDRLDADKVAMLRTNTPWQAEAV